MKKKLVTFILTGSILTASLAAPLTASADELTDKIQKQEQKVNELANRVSGAEEVLSTVNAEITTAEERAAELSAQRVETQDAITTLEKEIAKLQEIIDQREAQLEEQARSVQVKGSNESYVTFVFASESLTDLISRVDVVTKMVTANKDLVEKQIEDQQVVADKKTETEEKLNEIMAMSSELEQLKGTLEVKRIEQESAVAALSAEKATAEQDRQKFVAQKEEADRRAAEEAERQRLAAEEAAIQQAATEEAARQQAVVIQQEQTAGTVQEVVQTNTNTSTNTSTTNTSTASTPTVQAPAPTPAPVETPQPAAPSTPAPSGDLISVAYKYLGVPYVWGGSSTSGFDCSGFTAYVYREAYGVNIGGWTVPQENSGTQISVSAAQPGDLLFWGSRGGTYHVAIYLGGGQYIHAPRENDVVKVASLSSWVAPSFAVRVAR
ncbi:NlpC/P60 family protein [Jeotgalibaca sp. MA1X17-3]|uniref:C40 family peptidase n=1 Tax=Jeotgalibaca sp. MA1X17-3 TaxID=2908211 RepID=UPI001F16F173|nr:C40 family peptidase [Jeotgalibaca sp. MA1X17-3]UJF16189.1 NlpC/P60 family protein [Jeotgalibaca sp. MA1X17-3]